MEKSHHSSRRALRILRTSVLTAGFASAMMRAALADATPPSAAPTLPIPTDILNSPYVREALNALGAITQTVNGPTAFGKVAYFKQFDLQIQTAPTVYRTIRLHQGTVINPRGSSIASGEMVTVSGSPQPDGTLNADTITLK